MTRLLPRLASETAVYGLGAAAAQAVAILLVPIYARKLGPEGVGVTGVMNSILSLSLIVAGLALQSAFFRWYLKEADTERDRVRIFRTTVGIRIVASVAFGLLATMAAVPLTILLYGDATLAPVFALIGPIVAFDSYSTIPLSFLRAERRARSYVTVALVRAVVGSILIVTLVVGAGVGVIGVPLGSALAAVLGALVATWVVVRIRPVGPALDRSLARSMLAFCLPLVPAALAGWTLNLSDRLLLQVFVTQEAVGIYTLGYVFGLVVNALAIQPFTLAWAAAYWELAKRDDPGPTFARVLTGFTAAACFAALGVAAFATDAIRILVGPAFELSRYVVPFSAFAYVLYGVFSITAAGLNIASETRWVSRVTVGAAVGSVLLNLLLIPIVGYLGAAVSTLVSYLLLAVAATVVSVRYYPVAWDYVRVSVSIGVGFGLAMAALLGPDHVAWRLLTWAAFVPLMIVLRVVTLTELRSALESLWPR